MKREAVLDLGPVGVRVIVTALRAALEAGGIFADQFDVAAASDIVKQLEYDPADDLDPLGRGQHE